MRRSPTVAMPIAGRSSGATMMMLPSVSLRDMSVSLDAPVLSQCACVCRNTERLSRRLSCPPERCLLTDSRVWLLACGSRSLQHSHQLQLKGEG